MNNGPLFPASGKIYIITTGEYDDFNVIGAASKPEKAKEFMDQFSDEDFNVPKEMFIDDLMKIPKGKYLYFVRVKKDKSEVLEVKKEGIDIYFSSLAMNYKEDKDYKGNLMVHVFAKTYEEAERLALETVNNSKTVSE